jgi:hypothetical protein
VDFCGKRSWVSGNACSSASFRSVALLCGVLLCSVLFCSALFCFVLFCSDLLWTRAIGDRYRLIYSEQDYDYDLHIPLGELIHDCEAAFNARQLPDSAIGKSVCLVCPSGERARIAAPFLAREDYDVCALARGQIALVS